MVFSHFFHFLVSYLMLIIFLLITQQWYFFTLFNLGLQILGISLLLIFASGISLFASALTVFYRDINFVIQMGIMLWFYATPIIYPFSFIPEKYKGIFYLNPLITIFSWLQKSMVNLSVPLWISLIHILFILLIFFLGFKYFQKKEIYFSDWL